MSITFRGTYRDLGSFSASGAHPSVAGTVTITPAGGSATVETLDGSGQYEVVLPGFSGKVTVVEAITGLDDPITTVYEVLDRTTTDTSKDIHIPTGPGDLPDGAFATPAYVNAALAALSGTFADNPTPGTPKTALVTVGDQSFTGQLNGSGGKLVLPASTKAGLPAAGTAGRLARLTDDLRGLWVDNGNAWLRDSPIVLVDWFKQTGDTNDTDAITRAIAAVGPGTYAFGPRQYTTSAPIDPPEDSNFVGLAMLSGATVTSSRILNTTTDMWSWSTAKRGVTWSKMRMQATAGHIFKATGSGMSFCEWNRLTLVQNNNGKSVFHMDEAAADWIDNEIAMCNIFHTTAATVPTWLVKSGSSGLNSNTFRRTRFTNSGNYNIWLEGAGAGSYASDNVIRDITFEIPTGGAVKLLTANGAVLENCNVYDLQLIGPTTRDLFYVGKGAGALASRNVTLRKVQRRAGVLGGGLFDIKLEGSSGARSCVLEGCRGQNSAAGFTVDIGSNPTTILDMDEDVTITNASLQTLGRLGTQGPRANVIPTASLPAAAAAQDGRILIEDNGAGDRNLVVYAGGQRFRIDGGAAF